MDAGLSGLESQAHGRIASESRVKAENGPKTPLKPPRWTQGCLFFGHPICRNAFHAPVRQAARNLFSGQMCEAFWEPAAKNLANLSNTNSSAWITALQSETAPNLIRKIIGEGNQIYSELSKGIHPEFAVKRESEYDSPTLQTYLDRAFKWTTSLGLLSHCSATFSARLQLEDVLNHVTTIEEAVK